jgi:hypothetical protein
MGEHWGNPADMPLGPIYCVHEGRIVCLEFMIEQTAFTEGQSWPALPAWTACRPSTTSTSARGGRH